MRNLFVIFHILFSLTLNSQIISGDYGDLKIAFNPVNSTITGYYESYTGYDESTGEARFSCSFYLVGKYNDSIASIRTFDPHYLAGNSIMGKMRILDSTSLSILLSEEHGGCWNVNHFADDFVQFTLANKESWIEIRYIESEKSYFYKERNEASKRKAYLIKGDLFYIDAIENNWAHGKYYGKAITEGWLKLETISKN